MKSEAEIKIKLFDICSKYFKSDVMTRTDLEPQIRLLIWVLEDEY